MVQIDFALKEAFSWEKFCASQKDQVRDWSLLPDSSRRFLEALNIPQIHPDCLSLSYTNTDAPLMGPLTTHDYHESTLDSLLTLWKQASPAILVMSELWLRWFAALLAPMGIAYLMWRLLSDYNSLNKKQNLHLFRIVVASKLALASAVVLATDMSYVYQYGAAYGVSLVLASAFLALLCSVLYKRASIFVFCLLMLGLTWHLTYRDGSFQFGGDDLPYNVPEGLYYDNINPLVQKLISHWPADTRTYSPETGATPWTPTGDARTGIPFLVNFWQEELTLHKVWATAPDQEAVRLEVSFPQSGHHVDQPIYLVLHGLSGGSQEEYIKDFVIRANAEDSTVVIMIARGLMDTPIRGWNVFHGARVSDVAASAEALRPALSEGQYLIGAGYSMGAIVLANYVARSGQGCALDAAMAVSGVLDGRYQAWNDRAKRLWQPMLTITLRDQFVLGKLGERYRQRLSKKQMLELMRATHISGVDEHAVVSYNDFDDLIHYYSEMSAMGDIPLDSVDEPGRIANVSIPLCVLHALDDPLITWKTVAANQGLRHPRNLVKVGSGNLMLLLTKAGGHVGWPTGINPAIDKWKWMSEAVKSFGSAFTKAKNEV